MELILVSHGQLAKGMKDTLEMIVGPQSQVTAFSAYGVQDADFLSLIKAKIEQTQEPVVILTDILGGSVNNNLTQLMLQNHSITLITGMNLPLVLALATCSEDLTKTKIQELIRECRQSMVWMNEQLDDASEEEIDD
ncbi:PTS sugar transporter subunit IIA [Bombilactobacillus folatiphilus]|uniref:PTS sugar transporter subunit IIA n=1 Tax=Bombilactobacillus folatiphilus TaxID=2923362 RepID=A0ABY4P9Q9_9LACO|nr:PTS sugar transporter subunit IIA [Bombilactobacillus folatiphilus]UQS82266.1 PTS sugar transporter subunit IIA [Bombilactobacillus folatiphilus]